MEMKGKGRGITKTTILLHVQWLLLFIILCHHVGFGSQGETFIKVVEKFLRKFHDDFLVSEKLEKEKSCEVYEKNIF